MLWPNAGHTSIVRSAVWGPGSGDSGKRLASCCDDRTVRLWDASAGTQMGAPLTGHRGYVYSVSWSPDGRRLASASSDKTVRIWILRQSQCSGPGRRLAGRLEMATLIMCMLCKRRRITESQRHVAVLNRVETEVVLRVGTFCTALAEWLKAKSALADGEQQRGCGHRHGPGYARSGPPKATRTATTCKPNTDKGSTEPAGPVGPYKF